MFIFSFVVVFSGKSAYEFCTRALPRHKGNFSFFVVLQRMLLNLRVYSSNFWPLLSYADFRVRRQVKSRNIVYTYFIRAVTMYVIDQRLNTICTPI